MTGFIINLIIGFVIITLILLLSYLINKYIKKYSKSSVYSLKDLSNVPKTDYILVLGADVYSDRS